MRKFEPLKVDHPLVTEGKRCFRCNVTFITGDEVTLLSIGPADEQEAASARAGNAYNARAEPIHWACRPPMIDETAIEDPVLHETLSAVMWLCHAIDALATGDHGQVKALVRLARESVFKTLELRREETNTP